MTGPLTASALRQEGPQQEEPFTELEQDRVNKVLFGRVSERTRIRVMAALSALRTAQAPQQATQSWAVNIERNGESVVTLSSNMLAGRDLSDEDERVIRMAGEHLLAFIGSASMTDQTDLAVAQARIQVLETSVDYLRYLVDHPVKQETTTVPQQGTRWKDKAMERFVTVVGVSDTKVSYRNEASGRLTVTRKPSFMHIFERADPPVAPAEGEK